MIAPTLRTAAASVLRNPRRSILTAAAIANAVAGGLLFYGFTRHTYWGLAESFARAGNGHVQVADAAWFDAAAPEEHRVPRATLEAARVALAKDPEVAPRLVASAVRRQAVGMLVAGAKSGVFAGVGTEPGAEAALAPLAAPVEGRPLADGDAGTVVLGAPLAARLGVHPGDTVTAFATTDRGMTNAVDLEVRGLARTGAEELDRALATMPLDTALALADSDAADVLVLALRDTDDTDAVLAAVRRDLAADPALAGLAARPWYERASYYVAVRALYDRIFGVFEGLMALVTVLSLSHAVAAVVEERRAEIAMLRVVGLRRRDVAGVFVAEGALLGVAGCLGGVALAELVAWVVARAGGIPMPPPPGFTVGYAALIRLDALGFAIVLPVTLVAAAAAAAVPAWRATRGELSRGLAGLAVLLAAAVATGPARAGDLDAARARLAAADAARALPADRRCVLDLTVRDPAGSVGWRVAVRGGDALAVTTTLAPGRRQVALRTGEGSWFQTEAMRAPLRAGGGQRVNGQLAIADLLDARLSEAWMPVAMDGDTVRVEARPGTDAAYPRAELDVGADGKVRAGRYFAPSGKLVRTVRWTWGDAGLVAMEVADAARPDVATTVEIGAPRCDAGAWTATPATLLDAARALAGEGK